MVTSDTILDVFQIPSRIYLVQAVGCEGSQVANICTGSATGTDARVRIVSNLVVYLLISH